MPAHIREVLIDRYEYIVAEREVVPDLTDDLRLCDTCEKWCPPYVVPAGTLLLSPPVLINTFVHLAAPSPCNATAARSFSTWSA